MNTEQNQIPTPPVQEQVTPQPYPPTPAEEKRDEHVGFWTYFGLIALFSIPIAGLIACIIFLFAPKKKSIRNFAGAALTWIGVGITTAALIVTLLLGAFASLILPAINEQFGAEIGSISEVFDAVSDVKNGNYSGAINLFRGAILEAIGDDYAPLLDEFASGEYDDLIDQIKNKEYAQVLQDLENGVYDDLVKQLEPDDYLELKEELRRAANGDPSELFDELQSYFNLIPLP